MKVHFNFGHAVIRILMHLMENEAKKFEALHLILPHLDRLIMMLHRSGCGLNR